MDVQKEYKGAKHNLAASLQNESAEHRAKVLEFVLDWDINPNEEFFLIFAAIGHLKVLIEQAPEDIRQLFKSVLQELDEWSQITTEKLQIDSQHIKVTESLAQSSKALGTALNSLDITSTQQKRAIEELARTLEAFESRRRKPSQHELTVSEVDRGGGEREGSGNKQTFFDATRRESYDVQFGTPSGDIREGGEDRSTDRETVRELRVNSTEPEQKPEPFSEQSPEPEPFSEQSPEPTEEQKPASQAKPNRIVRRRSGGMEL